MLNKIYSVSNAEVKLIKKARKDLNIIYRFCKQLTDNKEGKQALRLTNECINHFKDIEYKDCNIYGQTKNIVLKKITKVRTLIKKSKAKTYALNTGDTI